MMYTNMQHEAVPSVVTSKNTRSDILLEEINDTSILPVAAASLSTFDVICGRCSLAFNNVGNRRFRVVIGLHIQRYTDASTRPAKGSVIMSVVRIFQNEMEARFVKHDKLTGDFVPVSNKIVRQKVGHALRDLAAAQHHSSAGGTGGAGTSIRCSTPPPARGCASMVGRAFKRSNSTSSTSSADSHDSIQSSQSAPNKVTSTDHGIGPSTETKFCNW